MKINFTLCSYVLIMTLIELFLIITGRPRLFIFITISSLIGYALIFHNNKWFGLNEENLLKQPLFIASILIPLHTFMVYGFWVWKGHGIDFTANGFNNFLEISKLPLLLLASSVPLAAIVNNVHRTIQVEKQITETSRKNLSDSYYTHLKFITEAFEKNIQHEIKFHDHSSKLKISHPLSLYRELFPKSNSEQGVNYEINKALFEFLSAEWEKLNFNIDAFRLHYDSLLSDKSNQKLKESLSLIINSIEGNIISIFKKLHVTGYHFHKMFVYRYDTGGIQTSFMSHEDMINKIALCETICLFIFEVVNTNDEIINKHLASGFIDQNSFTPVKFYDFTDYLIKAIAIPYKQPTFFKD